MAVVVMSGRPSFFEPVAEDSVRVVQEGGVLSRVRQRSFPYGDGSALNVVVQS